MAAFARVIFTAVFISLVKPGLGNDLPYFSSPPSHYEAKEDAAIGSSVGSITAIDTETGDTLTLSLDSIGKELFDIVDSGGTISYSGSTPLERYLQLKKKLDREARDSYNIQIAVKDNFRTSNRENTITLILIVLDVNDNRPIFQGTPYTAEIKENTPSSLVYKVSATDADLGSAKSVQYSFSDDCKITDCVSFLISSTRGEVSLNSTLTLDYEKRNRYNLDIVAKDRGIPPLNSSTTLVVTVTDESDQPPEFEKSSYRADINETIPIGFIVVQTKAFDGDRGINNPVKYAIIKGDDGNYFKIDNATGLISTNSTIDRDTGNDFFELTVEATEIPGNASSTTTAFITIEDINDNKPTFPATGFPYTASIPEDTPKGTPIFFQMGAVDNDREAKNAIFKYSIIGDPGSYFKIDSNIGRIELNKKIDFETERQFTFIVVARETNSVEKFSANQTITINITNVNDNKPQFNQSLYNFTVNESAESGTVLGQIMANDNDSGEFGKVTYSLSGDGAEKFSVTPDNGTISVAGSLDFESKQSYSLELEAKDGGNIVVRVPVNIVITDTNDNTPEFDPFPTSVNLDENKVNVFSVAVKATDKDSGNNSAIKYSIVGGDPMNNFTIDAVSGEIKNAGPLDFETKEKFSLVIMAADLGSPSRNSTETLFIKVNDQNDNSPYFNKSSFNVALMENTDIDYRIVQLHAFDKDSGKNAEIVYSIISGNDEKKFTIDADGFLLTRSSPDRETTAVYTLNISASDSGTPKLYAYAKVIVNILDENDESPKFKKTVDKKIIKEGPTTLNSSVANNTASDGDLGLNGTIKYTIEDGNSEDIFGINPLTGDVTVTRELDFEEVRIYSLKIVASDEGTPSRSGEYQLVVEVLDINDNEPRFGQPEYSFTVMENRPNGTVIVTLRADDRDSGSNKYITYSFSYGNDGSAFSINNETGQISTGKELDRETRSQYLLVVKASDHGNPALEGTTNVTITVLDENDQTPEFTSTSYNISIPENTAKGTSVFTLSATDGDDGPAGQVTYLMQDIGNLENGNNIFSIGSKSGELKSAITLDFEIHQTFTLTVTASDNGAPSNRRNVTLYVTIKDVDDNAPTFAKNTWSAVVNENDPTGTAVTRVYATDVDFEVVHKTVYYAIVGGNDDGVFGIENENGTVYIANTTSIDRETKGSYELEIEARSLNEFRNVTVQQSTTKLTITVEDYNDNSPVFQKSSYERKIPESFELNEVIDTVIASDKDTGKNKEISYFISSGNDEGIFAIDNATGVVTIVKRLDRETTKSHKLTVTARDHGTPSLERNVSVTVSVTDANDKRPILIIPFSSFPILENATIGTVVTRFNATDEDLDKNGQVGYQIVSGNTDGMFGINNHTGELFTAKLLDYEDTKTYEIGVQAFDNGSPNLHSDIKLITINVEDINDNPPTFSSQKTTTMSVPENKDPGSVVGKVEAKDNDATDPLYYYLRGGNGASYFTINETSGVVSTTSKLDREKDAAYFIYVQVFNSKQTPKYIQSLGDVEKESRRKKRAVDTNVVPVIPKGDNVQLVMIDIADRNDNPPYFKHDSYTAGVSENAEYQSRITQITCIDNDKGNNSMLTYKVVDLEPSELLSVEPETGWILAGQQQYFASGVGKIYTFSYSCEDPSYNATTRVTIFVLVDDQRVRLTLGINDTDYVRQNIDEIKKALDDATGLEFNVDSIQYHLQSNGKYDLSKTDIFMHAVDPKTNKVVDKNTVLKLIDTNYGSLIDIFQKYKVDAVEAKKPDGVEGGFDVTLAAAVALGVILFMLLLCFLCVICLMRRSHNRKLRAAKAIGSQDQSYGLTTPGTNLHVYEGSNPVWMDPYDNWKTGDDKTSSNAKLYENQELSMDMFGPESPGSRVLPGTFYESTVNGAAYHPNGILNLTPDKNMGDDEEEVTNI